MRLVAPPPQKKGPKCDDVDEFWLGVFFLLGLMLGLLVVSPGRGVGGRGKY